MPEAGTRNSRGHGRRSVPIELDRLRWIAVVLPVAFILIVEAFRQLFLAEDPAQQSGHLALAGILIVGVIPFAFVMFVGIEAMRAHALAEGGAGGAAARRQVAP